MKKLACILFGAALLVTATAAFMNSTNVDVVIAEAYIEHAIKVADTRGETLRAYLV